MPMKPIFLSVRLANLPQRIQERSASTEDGIECVLSDFEDDTGKKLALRRNLSKSWLPIRYLHLAIDWSKTQQNAH